MTQDVVLTHRLGLIPFKGGREGLLNFHQWWWTKPEEGISAFPNTFDFNTAMLELRVACTRNKEAAKNENDLKKLYNHSHVYASDIVSEPEVPKVSNTPSQIGASQHLSAMGWCAMISRSLRPSQGYIYCK